ncbi:MAG TPA: hypothetical protein PLV85_04875 [Polyangiaceae bacterium]|nr:hypothetical protein [Polyangiaceae bacterium]HQB42913.1 hypothetical protein [Polyangiaceae bacterium]
MMSHGGALAHALRIRGDEHPCLLERKLQAWKIAPVSEGKWGDSGSFLTPRFSSAAF